MRSLDERIRRGTKKAEELRARLGPLKKSVEEVELALGDKRADLERTGKSVRLDLEELRRRVAAAEAALHECGTMATETSQMQPKDAERQIDVAMLDESVSPLVLGVSEIKEQVLPRLQTRVEEFEERVAALDTHKPNAKILLNLDRELEEVKQGMGEALD